MTKNFCNIFSVTNQENYKIICILGFKISIKRQFFYKLLFEKLPINKNKIVFANFHGQGFGCNPKYIAEEIIRQKLPYKLVWLVKDANKSKKNNEFPPEIKLVEFKSLKALKELATARLWVDNQRKSYHIRKGLYKKENQFYIQTWHGSLGIKKIGEDSPLTKIDNKWVPHAKADAKMINYILSNSKFETEIFKRNFWNCGEIKEYGHPRNDVLIKKDKKIKEKVYKYFNLQKYERIVLYAPSFRDDKKLDCYNLNYQLLLNKIKDKFGGSWILLIRLHPNYKNFTKQLIPKEFDIIDGTNYPDIQELMAASDIMISDYSSCMFDFMLMRKPVFVYASDINDFDQKRGFYYPLKSTPFPISQDEFDLTVDIKMFDYKKYCSDITKFLNNKKCIEDGNASKRTIELIKEIME